MRSGFIGLIGRPNVGKSTLLNAIIGRKVAITSDKPQTTRNLIHGIYTKDNVQMVFVDTPGIHKPKNKLGKVLNKEAYYSVNDVDIILWLVDITEDLSMSTKYSPIYKTNIFGTNSNKTIIIDDMERSGLIMDIKEGRAALKEIRIFSNGKKITRIDNQYICYNNKEKDIIISHQSNSYDETNKNYTIIISKDDYIKNAIIFLSSRKNNVKDVEFTTSKGMKLKISNHKSSNYKELKETKGKKLRILGMCVGSEKYIQFIQFYYELINLEI